MKALEKTLNSIIADLTNFNTVCGVIVFAKLLSLVLFDTNTPDDNYRFINHKLLTVIQITPIVINVLFYMALASILVRILKSGKTQILSQINSYSSDLRPLLKVNLTDFMVISLIFLYSKILTFLLKIQIWGFPSFTLGMTEAS